MARLGDIVGQRPVRKVAHVSTGPWYGFNGVQALVLTDDALYRVQQGLALRPDRVMDTFLLTDLSDVFWRPGRRGRSGRIAFSVAGSRRSYASKWRDAVDLVEELTVQLR